MKYITGTDRSQAMLLPPSLYDYVGQDNVARLIDAFVDGLDFGEIGFVRAKPPKTGRPVMIQLIC